MDFLKYNMDGEIKPMMLDILRLVTIFFYFFSSVFSFYQQSQIKLYYRRIYSSNTILILSLMVFWMVIYKFINKNIY